MLTKFIVILGAFTVIESPFNHRPYVNNIEIQSNNPITPQEVIRKEYDQVRYTYDPLKTNNQHASLEMPLLQHSYDAPIHVHPSINPHQIRNSMPEAIHLIHQHIPQVQSYTHLRPILWTTSNEFLSPFNHHSSNRLEQTPNDMIPHALPQDKYFSNPPNVMEHSQRQVHPTINPPQIRNSIPETMHSIHQHVPQYQSYTHRRPILSRTTNEFSSPFHHNSFSRLEQTPNDMINYPLTQDNFLGNPQPVMEHSNSQVSQPFQRQQLSHTSVEQLPMPQRLDIEPTSVDAVKRGLHDASSVEIRSKSGITGYDMPEYDETLKNLNEIAHSASIVADNPKATIRIKKTMKMADMFIYMCILESAKIRHSFPPRTAYFCCEKHLKAILIETEVYKKICTKYREIIFEIPQEEKRHLRSIYPNTFVPRVNQWVLERYE